MQLGQDDLSQGNYIFPRNAPEKRPQKVNSNYTPSLRSWRFCWGARASGEAAASYPFPSRNFAEFSLARAPQQNRQLRRLLHAKTRLFNFLRLVIHFLFRFPSTVRHETVYAPVKFLRFLHDLLTGQPRPSRKIMLWHCFCCCRRHR